jgi:hypothetical protein
LNRNPKIENNNFKKLFSSTNNYLQKRKIQEDYLKIINNIKNNYYYPLNQKNSIILDLLSTFDLISNDNCYSYHIIIGNKNNLYLLCINYRYNLLSLYNLTIINKKGKKIITIPLFLNLDYTFPIHLSFSSLNEEQATIYIFNKNMIYSVSLVINNCMENFSVSSIKNYVIPASKISSNLRINNNLIYLSTFFYHGNRYIIYGYSTGEIKIFIINEKSNDHYLSIKTTFNLHKKINKIYQMQDYLFIVTNNKRNINVISLLESNNILINCYNYNEIIDLVFDDKEKLLYILDKKGNIMIKELAFISKVYQNGCKHLYKLQIPNYIVQKHNGLNKKINLIIAHNMNIVYIVGYNYFGFINNNFILENYIIYNQNNKINNLEKYNNIFVEGSMTFLLANYNKKLLIYEIKNIKDENNKKENKGQKKYYNNKKMALFNAINLNSRTIQCEGNVICKLLLTNYKNIINTLYIIFIIIILFSKVYHYNKNKNGKRKIKTFQEDNYNNKEINGKLSEILKSKGNYSIYKTIMRKKSKNLKENNYFKDDNEEEYKEYYGDVDDDNNEDDIIQKNKNNKGREYLRFNKNLNKKSIVNDLEEDIENNINNNIENQMINRYEEEEKDTSSQEDSDDSQFKNN